MSIKNAGVRAVRNGLPEHRPYRYNGNGYDQLTAGLSVAELAADHLGIGPAAAPERKPERQDPLPGTAQTEEDPEPELRPVPRRVPIPPPPPARVRSDLFTRAPARSAWVPAAAASPAPSAQPEPPAPRTLHAGRELICHSCGGRIPRGDRYRREMIPGGPRGRLRPAQFHEGCLQAAEPAPPVPPAREPAQKTTVNAQSAAKDARCPKCRYLVTAPGHLIICGSAS